MAFKMVNAAIALRLGLITCLLATCAAALWGSSSKQDDKAVYRIGVAMCDKEAGMTFAAEDLDDLAQFLHEQGHDVQQINTDQDILAFTDEELDLDTDDLDVIIACGVAGQHIFDYVELAYIPYVKVSQQVDATFHHAAIFEWPDLIVSNYTNNIPPYFSSVPVVSMSVTPDGLRDLEKQILDLATKKKEPEICGASFQDYVNRPRPALALNMIVKNEAATITDTLESLRDNVDYWAILDTGSTDGTPELIEKAMVGIPGQVAHSNFVDFEVTRNKGLRLVKDLATWVMVLDGDHIVRGMWRLQRAARRIARACKDLEYPVCAQGVMTQRITGALSLWWTRVWSSDFTGTWNGWHFEYPVHEFPTYAAVPREHISYKYTPQVSYFGGVKHNKSTVRWREFDLPVLAKALKKKPNDSRLLFYYAQTLDCLEENELAVEAYQKRVDVGGWWEETYMAMVRKGRVEARMPGRDPTETLLKAYAFHNKRAEAVFSIADWHVKQVDLCSATDTLCKTRHHLLAFLYAKEAASKDRNSLTDLLFIDDYIYEYKAKDLMAVHGWHIKQSLGDTWAQGKEMAKYLVDTYPEDTRYQANLNYYLSG